MATNSPNLISLPSARPETGVVYPANDSQIASAISRAQENLLGPNIYIWNAASPVGPFTKKRLVYTTPQKVGSFKVWTYNAKAHPELSVGDSLLVGYCTNSQTTNGLYKNADTYRPYFVWATNWQ